MLDKLSHLKWTLISNIVNLIYVKSNLFAKFVKLTLENINSFFL